eukprot:GHVS01059436.1.p1 GENE.GHVS01059436.1~~GHVS01059436.1.p1  ORF type:complete len:157 (-),score=23.48 GHVS01059436.1:181-651(-)
MADFSSLLCFTTSTLENNYSSVWMLRSDPPRAPKIKNHFLQSPHHHPSTTTLFCLFSIPTITSKKNSIINTSPHISRSSSCRRVRSSLNRVHLLLQEDALDIKLNSRKSAFTSLLVVPVNPFQAPLEGVFLVGDSSFSARHLSTAKSSASQTFPLA